MSFRRKFLLTLLAFSLLPLLLVSAVNLRSFKKQGETFAERTGQELAEIVRSELLSTVRDFADSLKAGERSLWFALALLKEVTQDALAGEPSKGAQIAIVTTKDFDHPDSAPEDVATLDQLRPLAAVARRSRVRASLGHAAVTLQDDGAGAQQQNAARLTALQPVQYRLFEKLGPDGFQQHICLEQGVYSVYPGHGGFPPDFDCKQLPWYQQTRASMRPDWSGPLADPVFGEPLYVLSMPLVDEQGRFLGVAALDYPLTMLLQEQRLALRWSEEARSYLVAMQHNTETGHMGLLAFAQHEYKEIPANGKPPEYAWLASSDTPGFRRLLERMLAEDAGVAALPLDGTDALWAFARYGTEYDAPVFFLVVLPRSVFTRLPDSFSSQALELFRSQGFLTLGTLVGATGLVVLVALLGARSVTRPLLQISDAAQRLSQGDFDVRLDMRLGDERQRLVDVINNLGPELANYMEMRKSLEVAEEVQKNLLPHGAPRIPGFDVSGTSLYCDETGGDYYDFLTEEVGSRPACAAIVGDVTGHGIPSALLMATARALFRGIMARTSSLAERMTLVNRLLAQDLYGTGRFMTMFVVELEADAASVNWVRAGHDPALVYRPDSDDFLELAGVGLPLGVLDDYVYEQYADDCMRPGCILVMGTDGIWETVCHGSCDHSKMFGKERLQQTVRDNASLPASGIQQAVLEAVAAWRGDGRQTDDITLTVIKRL